jgi:hypothetical protein
MVVTAPGGPTITVVIRHGPMILNCCVCDAIVRRSHRVCVNFIRTGDDSRPSGPARRARLTQISPGVEHVTAAVWKRAKCQTSSLMGPCMARTPSAQGAVMPAIGAARAGPAKMQVLTTLSSPVLLGPAGVCHEYRAISCRATTTTRAARHSRADPPAAGRTTRPGALSGGSSHSAEVVWASIAAA